MIQQTLRSMSTRANIVTKKAVPFYSLPSLSAPLTQAEIPIPTVRTNAVMENGTGMLSSPKYLHCLVSLSSKYKNGQLETHSLFLCKKWPSMHVRQFLVKFSQVSQGDSQTSHCLEGVGTEMFGHSVKHWPFEGKK